MQLFEIFNSLSAEAKVLSVKVKGPEHVDSSIISIPFLLPFYYVKTSAPVEIRDCAATEDVTQDFSELIHTSVNRMLNKVPLGRLSDLAILIIDELRYESACP